MGCITLKFVLYVYNTGGQDPPGAVEQMMIMMMIMMFITINSN